MAQKSAQARIGEGIYTAADAARIFKIPYKKAQYWFNYYVKNKLFDTIGYQYHFEIKDTVAVNFLSLIEMIVFYTLKEKGVKTKDIIQSHTELAKYYDTYYPFAYGDIYAYGREILIKEQGEFFLAKDVKQRLFKEFVLEYAHKIDFGDDRLAHKYYPLGKDKAIVVDPEHQFGQPVIVGTNILTDTLYDLYLGGDSIKFISQLYNITEQNVKDAIEFSKAA